MDELSIKLASARAKLPLPNLLEQHGNVCPWCQNKSASFRTETKRSGKVAKASIAEAEARVDVVALIGQSVELKNASGNFVGLCPFHNEKNPSFNVYPATQSFHCFGCNKTGGPVEFVKATEGKTFMESLERVAAFAGVTLHYDNEVERQYFVCTHEGCGSNLVRTGKKGRQLDEVDFLAKCAGFNFKEAALAYLKQAGVWQEDRLPPSVMPGQRARRYAAPHNSALPPVPPADVQAESEPSPLSQSQVAAGSQEVAGREAVPDVPPSAGTSTAAPTDAPARPADAASLSPALAGTQAPTPAATGPEGAAPENGSSGGPPATPPSPPPPDEPEPGPRGALRWFYRRLQWSDADQQLMWKKRALTPLTCRWLGFRSNPKMNEALLIELATHYPPAVLVESGLYLEGSKPTDLAYPNPQFYGMSLQPKRTPDGKKVRDEHGDPVTECVWNHPVLIPYFDEDGELIHLRPHKGMMRGKSPRFYAVRVAKEHRAEFQLARPKALVAPTWAHVSEGEFKAAAVWQVFGGEIAAGAMPGITMAKPLFGDVEEWLEGSALRQVVVGYDREDKGDPELPGFQKDVRDRYDAEVWARYLARQLAKLGYDAKVCVLPKEWLIEGKADWDGRLAQRLDALGKEIPEPDAELFWLKCGSRVRAEFEAVIKTALPVQELWQAGFFDSEAERAIKNKLEGISYEAKLPIGGDDELIISRRLYRLVPKLNGALPDKMRGFLLAMAKAYADLKGGYYTFRALKEEKVELWQAQLEKARNSDNQELKRACELALKGMPVRISDFYMKAHYVLNKMNGTRERLVELHNIHGVHSKQLGLPSSAFAQPSKFREWLLNSITGATWTAGERELNALQADTARAVAFKDVAEVAQRGYHADSKCWFFGDVTFLDGKEKHTDKKGIQWINEGGESEIWRGYKLAATDHEDQTFRHGEPLMHPKVKATDAEITALFEQVAHKLYETVGNFGGYLALGTVLAFGAAPEIYATFNGFPGLWLHGETRQGKSSVARWMMRVWGMNVDIGITLLDSTKPGLSIALQQYGSLPVWLEEYQPDAPGWLTEKLKNIYDRGSGSKKTFDEGDRKILAGAIVTGVATSLDAQVKSRYAHVQVAEANRIANHYDWFQAECGQFYKLGRYIMRNRADFSKRVIETMRHWLKTEMVGTDARARVIHSAAYAALYAVGCMLGPELDMPGFKQFLVQHCVETTRETTEAVNVNQFWRDLLDALEAGAFGNTPGEIARFFKIVDHPAAKSPVSAAQWQRGVEDGAYSWKSKLLYLRQGPVIDLLRVYKRRQGRDLPLDRTDLRHQMQGRGYWVAAFKQDGSRDDEGHRQRFGFRAKNSTTCWCIDMDRHELGYRPVPDDGFVTCLYKNLEKKEYWPRLDWIDPRKGDLFALEDALRSNRVESSQDANQEPFEGTSV